MALKATIFKANLQISDIDRNYYGEHALTLARHPSETDERMMVRVLAFALNAHEHLAFGKGISATDEPDLWQKDLTGQIVHWIDVGQPEDKRLIRASGRAQQVSVYLYGRSADLWWKANAERLARAGNLAVWRVAAEESAALGTMAERTMQLQCTVQENQVWLSNTAATTQLSLACLQPRSPAR
ncbi:MAG: YaeQ family protein [Burkholderiales bacterium]